jgi:hypothetical protein
MLLLPPHKRQAMRLFVLQTLIDLLPVYNGFDNWRAQQHRLININSQKKVLESYLRMTIHPAVLILTYTETLVLISLLVEEQLISAGLEEERMEPFPLLGEITNELAGFDFVVLVPAGVDTEKTKIEIEKFNAIDKHYKIEIK